MRDEIGLRSGDLIFDVGANVGDLTGLYLQLGTRVVCFEPQPECIEILNKKYADNSHVFIEPIGLSYEDTLLQMHVCSDISVFSSFSPDWLTGRFASPFWTKTITVPVSTLDKMITKYGMPRFCKVDVEGFEYEVFRGLSAPIPCVSFEFVGEFFDKFKLIVDYLKNIGYTKFNFTITNKLGFVFKDWLSFDIFLQEMETINKQDWSKISGLWGDVYARI